MTKSAYAGSCCFMLTKSSNKSPMSLVLLGWPCDKNIID